MTDLNNEIGKRIAMIRKVKHLTQAKLGDKIGVSYQIIGKCERGERELTAIELSDIANVLNVPQEFITNGIPESIEKKDFILLDKESLYEKGYQNRAREQAIAYHAELILNLWDIFQYYIPEYLYSNGREKENYRRLKGSLRNVANKIRRNKYVTSDNVDLVQKLVQQLAETFLFLIIDYEKLDIKNHLKPVHFSEKLHSDITSNGYYLGMIFGF
ncbi:helix-turn-helix transcriptional regulator [Lactobacillus sp. LL6]|uniref:helix-turn-helix domain-containing protein n=1 Tax=Lactobacillus sp. LL6 TaxID=2596827 RepID=UPI0011870B94|nr:helix-turn-helix transcriptional regulator [Lactobacillus sp. LL6]TSO25698.1 helix-turn-helix transcriptional regulator [Lactobacillus sp. LL6]